MPLFYQHNINQQTKLAIWKIEEEESFFLKEVSLKNEIHHPAKRLQHLAGRYLLKYLFPDFPSGLIEIADTRKPFLPGDPYHFSISHCREYAAALVSTSVRTGIDIEIVTSKIERVSHKFLKKEELELIREDDQFQLTLLWSCKEAIFKWYSHGGVDFREHMHIQKILPGQNQGKVYCSFSKDCPTEMKLQYCFFESLCLAWVVE